MEHITALDNIGAGVQCIIIGGGHSVNDFDFGKVRGDVVIIGTNQHKEDIADIIIYYDKNMMPHFNKKPVRSDYLIGFKNKATDHTVDACTHYYTYNDMDFGDSGYHALQFASEVFKFEEIYLIGFDYKVKGDSYHYDEAVSNPKKQRVFIKWSIDYVLDKYKYHEWGNNIYNLSPDSALKQFPYQPALTNEKK